MKKDEINTNCRFWEQIFDAMPDLIFVINNQFQILYANRSATEQLGVSSSELLYTPCYKWMHGTDGPPKFCPQCKTLEDHDTHMLEALAERLGKNFWVTTSPVFNEHGEYIASVHTARDISERLQKEEQLRHASVHDALTGIFNRAWFETELNRIANGRVAPVSVIVADLNGLKGVNDSEGHAAGDELLRRAALILSSVCRKADGVSRIGGDEFALLLPGMDNAEVKVLLQRIRKRIEEEAACQGDQSISIALGAATADSPQQLTQALKSADKNMYQDKRSENSLLKKGTKFSINLRHFCLGFLRNS